MEINDVHPIVTFIHILYTGSILGNQTLNYFFETPVLKVRHVLKYFAESGDDIAESFPAFSV